MAVPAYVGPRQCAEEGCTFPAAVQRVVEGLVVDLCATHAAALDRAARFAKERTLYVYGCALDRDDLVTVARLREEHPELAQEMGELDEAARAETREMLAGLRGPRR